MGAFITTDLHLVDDPRQAYRFELFPWLRRQLRRKPDSYLFILGDLTDEKDRHSAILVNRVVRELARTAEVCRALVLLAGNHDCIDPSHPFFEFVRRIPRVIYVKREYDVTLTDLVVGKKRRLLFLAHSRHPQAAYATRDYSPYDYVFIHQTLDGVQSESGAMLSGLPHGVFSAVRRGVFSGDIHKPQVLGPVTYVGAPYHVHFGDRFRPRLLYLDDGERLRDLHYPCLRKYQITIGSLEDLQKGRAARIGRGEHVKITVRLVRERFAEWPELRQKVQNWAGQMGWVLFGIKLEARAEESSGEMVQKVKRRKLSPEQIISDYCAQERLSDQFLAAGLWYVKEGRRATSGNRD